ncbi:MAG: hypothetical protein IPI31_07720 [Bacteroidetes bacterium]|nr:hypothetical protein [Bacteroidota bacterium]MBK7567705.1 hypothetical protein [Bacteroidota bacterium]MBP8916194.1 hypothetical protein [Chitinophagales bacterium]MBP9794909.1 hypothetical protein [Chitinophagales bacterium]
MKNSVIYVMFLMVISFSFYACQQSANGSNGKEEVLTGNEKLTEQYKPDANWNSYWYQGKAEITSYKLMQSRYGEIHEGTAVNIFVTEDFSRSKQVKLDDPSKAGDDKLPILKLNQSIKFNTGIYPYSIMMSAFSPVDINNYPHAVKITGSIQEWCGMATYQMNNKKNKFEIEQRSYFEQEGDKEISLTASVQEDELWNLIRLNPDKLPRGEISILPGTEYLRLSHKPTEAVKANLDLRDENGIMVYVIDMPSLQRKLLIRFEKSFPYKIMGWEDAYPGIDGVVLTTTAIKNKELLLDYWRTHNNADRILREQLGLPKDAQ